MKAFRYLALVVALAIPGVALADHVTSSSEDCCATGSSCCPHCPKCAHARP